jgi:hypothetical protein
VEVAISIRPGREKHHRGLASAQALERRLRTGSLSSASSGLHQPVLRAAEKQHAESEWRAGRPRTLFQPPCLGPAKSASDRYRLIASSIYL